VSLETVKDVLLWAETQFGDKPAVVDAPGGARWNYSDLGDRARRICAGYAREAGVEKGDRVCWLSLCPCADVVALSFGARKMGAIPVVMNARASAERLAWMIENVQAKALAYTSDSAELLSKVRAVGIPSVKRIFAVDEPAGLAEEVTLAEVYAAGDGSGEPNCDLVGSDPCLLIYTSGSTGRPKPVMHSEDGWSWLTMTLAYQFALYYDDTILNLVPPNFAGWAHVVGASVRAAANQCCVRFEPTTVLEVAAQERTTHGLFSPTLIRMLYEAYRAAPESIPQNVMRVGVVGGEAITAEILAMVKKLFPELDRLASLGATEAVVLHSGQRSRYLEAHASVVGKPLPGVSVELRDEESDQRLAGSGTGLMYVQGPGVAAGIWDDLDATAANFPDGWWRSGDVLARDDEGYYAFAGRTDHMFKAGNIKVYVEEVEEILKSHEAVLDAVVVPVPDPRFGQVAFAYVRNSQPLTADIITTWWNDRGAPGYSRPRHWRFQGEESFPMVTAAKIDRVSLRRRAEQELATIHNAMVAD
jgi:fatty-acyl-CoA synthase